MGDLTRARKKKWMLAGIIALAIVAFSIFDCFSAPLKTTFGEDTAIEMIIYGLAIAQLNLLAIWMALAPTNIVQRLSWSLLLMFWMWYSYTVGYCWWTHWFGLYGPMYSLQYALVLGYTLIIGFVVAQIPLWIAGIAYGWRLVGSKTSGPARGQFNLRHLLWAMVVTALIIVPGRFIVPPRGTQILVFDGELALVLLVLGVCNLFTMILCLWLVFFQKWPFIFKLIAALICLLLISSAEYRSLVEVFLLRDQRFFYWYLVGLMNVTHIFIVYVALLLLRALGFQFIQLPPSEVKVA